MGNARPHIPFSCPVCQHDEFVPVRVKTRDGGMRLTQSYECRGCSVVFRDLPGVNHPVLREATRRSR